MTDITQARADATPRYQQPMDPPEPPKDCEHCDHMVEIVLGGKRYKLCVVERDVSASGEVEECDPEMKDCMDWDEHV